MKRMIAGTLLLLSLAATQETKQVEAVRSWLAKHAVPMKNLEGNSNLDDLLPLEKILKNVRVVGLGEATHGTREFFQAKNRVIEFLVTRMGFNIVSIEASAPACMNINDYVVEGEGDPAKALASQGFSQLDTEDELALLEWLRRHNRALPEARRVRFVGFDMQGGYQYAINAILELLRKGAPDQIAAASQALAALKEQSDRPMPIASESPEDKARDASRLEAMYSFLSANREKLIRETSRWDYDAALLDARVLVEGAQFQIAMAKRKEKAALFAAVGLRDVYMAENIGIELKMMGPGARIIASGHNGHIQAGPWGAGIPGMPGARIPAMGEFLRKTYGEAYYAIGTDFDRGSFQALGQSGKGMELQEFTLPPAPEGSLAWYMKAAGESYFANLRSAPRRGPVANWLTNPIPMTVVTGAFTNGHKREEVEEPVVLKQFFDGLIFVEKTTRSRPIAGIAFH